MIRITNGAFSAVLLSLLSFFAFAPHVLAQTNPADVFPLDATLVIDNPNQTVGPNDSVDILATLTNNSLTETIFGSEFYSASIVNGTLIDLSVGTGNPYNINFGGPGTPIHTLLSAIDLAPGESFSFQFANLFPDPAPVSPGTYSSSRIGLEYSPDGGTTSIFEVFSTNGIEVTVVPEPHTVCLVLASLLLLGANRSRTF